MEMSRQGSGRGKGKKKGGQNDRPFFYYTSRLEGVLEPCPERPGVRWWAVPEEVTLSNIQGIPSDEVSKTYKESEVLIDPYFIDQIKFPTNGIVIL